jgi:hypothetical protein
MMLKICSSSKISLLTCRSFVSFFSRAFVVQGKEKFRDALVFVIDCSAPMQFPADLRDLDYDVDSIKLERAGEGASIESAAAAAGGYRPSHDASPAQDGSGGAAAAASLSSSEAASRARALARTSLAQRDTQFQMVLRVVLQSIRRKIISNPDDLVGLVLFGTKKSKTSSGASHKHFYVYTPLGHLSADIIRSMDKLLEGEYFEATVGAMDEREVLDGQLQMDSVFEEVNKLFKDTSGDDRTQRIILLTNNDQPYKVVSPRASPVEMAAANRSRELCINRGKDLMAAEIGVELIAVGKKPDASGNVPQFNPE